MDKKNVTVYQYLKEQKYRDLVSKFGLKFGKKSRDERLGQLVDCYRYANPSSNNNKPFLLPYDTMEDTIDKVLEDVE